MHSKRLGTRGEDLVLTPPLNGLLSVLSAPLERRIILKDGDLCATLVIPAKAGIQIPPNQGDSKYAGQERMIAIHN